jgi:hypothetical protein
MTIESYYNRKKTNVDEQRYFVCLNDNNKNKMGQTNKYKKYMYSKRMCKSMA